MDFFLNFSTFDLLASSKIEGKLGKIKKGLFCRLVVVFSYINLIFIKNKII